MDRGEDLRDKLFSQLNPKGLGIDFENTVTYTEEFNVYTYRNYYNGGGVGIGDLNNDGLADLFFCGNQVDNKLYINRGDFQFDDITTSAGVASPDVWSTGVSIADINGDGWQDIYVCKSGSPDGENRHNELFLNNGDLTFSEKAEEYGINDFGLSTHAAFFDYDKDGDLDCYLLNNSFKSVGGYDISPGQREIRDPEGGNKLYRNEGSVFTDVSEEAGIYGSNIGFGLGVTIGDVNKDGWQDIYVSNDFFEKDYLYINNKDGTFTENLGASIKELSLGSMGADMADINNDGFPEIFVTEMLPEEEGRLKTKSQFDSWNEYKQKVKNGFYHQFSRNVLQLNRGYKPHAERAEVYFSEIGRFAGVDATDWSWGALIFDMNNDGFKDLFVANGIYKDLLDRDYINFMANPATVRELRRREGEVITRLVDAMPSQPLSNYAFMNNGDLTFSNMAEEWGLGSLSFSNGSAYADLDNDGDLDIVVNNVNMPPFIFRNESRQKNPGNHYMTFKLTGNGGNRGALGAQVTLKSNDRQLYQELAPMRGFQSTVDNRLHFGLGNLQTVDSIIVKWPNNATSVFTGVHTDTLIELSQPGTTPVEVDLRPENNYKTIFQPVAIQGLSFPHEENEYIDFNRDRLLFHMMSTEGPPLAVGDINGDGRHDVYIGGAKDQVAGVFIQNTDGSFSRMGEEAFENDKLSEDIDAEFFDADGDSDLDLYVASGGNEFSSSSSALIDRLYVNDGNGHFSRSPQKLPDGKPVTSSCVKPADFDGDGDMDLFVGARLKPFLYGVPVNGYILNNDGEGNFTNVTARVAPSLIESGLIMDAVWFDHDNDGDPDLAVAGEWMPVKLFENKQGVFDEITEPAGMSKTHGFWKCIRARDLNNDGNIDLVAGNLGLNTRFHASEDHPMEMYVNDFDRNGSAEQIITIYNKETSYPLVMLNELARQMPGIRQRYLKHEDYKLKTVNDIFTQEQLNSSVHLYVYQTSTSVFINEADGMFRSTALPDMAQLSPTYALEIEDFNADGLPDIILGGNLHRAKPQTGIYNAGYGGVLLGKGDGTFSFKGSNKSGLFVEGEIRDFKIFDHKNNKIILVSRSNNSLLGFKIMHGKTNTGL